MFGKTFVRDLINRSAENEQDRRRFIKSASVAGLGVVSAGVIANAASSSASAAPSAAATAAAGAPSDGAILNFALNLEYLEAEFYSYAVNGYGLTGNLTTGTKAHGKVTGGHQVPWKTSKAQNFAKEIAGDELAPVKFLRTALGGAAVSEPDIDLRNSFTAAAMAAGLIGPGQTFDPFGSEENFLLGAFIFEDVGVTAYKGAAPLITNKTYLEAAAGILAVEAYHASNIRTRILETGLAKAASSISWARDQLDGPVMDDQGLYNNGFNVVPADANGIAFSRTPGAVLNIVYLNKKEVTSGGFFPSGVNGELNTSNAN
ncbi:MAG: ferritin-like domain-containing protein [Actinomycetota bacterium]|nr:ferritin-like domain-containing protein [Actinomycetota bacterium]